MTSAVNKPWLLPFLRRMTLRPGAYLGSESVSALYLYISAYRTARADLGVPELAPGEEALLTDFYEWLAERAGTQNTRRWVGLIEREDPSDTNIRTFISRFDEFLKGTGRPGLR